MIMLATNKYPERFWLFMPHPYSGITAFLIVFTTLFYSCSQAIRTDTQAYVSVYESGEVQNESRNEALTVLPPDEEPPLFTIPEQPEIATGYTPKPGWHINDFAVAAAHPLAADAGYQILKAGGSALDAAIAAQMVLTLVEPQSSGIGGGAFLMHWDGTRIDAYDGRERAPFEVDETLFLDDDENPVSFRDAVHGGWSVGVPGTLAMLKTAHRAHGKLPWEYLFIPAITLSEAGFPVSPRLHLQLANEERLRRDSLALHFFYQNDNTPLPKGYLLKNPALSEILRNVSKKGPSAFYQGEIAEDIVSRIRNHKRPGKMSIEDLAVYPEQDFQRTPICTPWRAYVICGFPPPSSGHLTIMQILGIMEELELPEKAMEEGIPSAEWLHYYFEASKRAYADRDRYIADPSFVEPPGADWEAMLNPAYLKSRAEEIGQKSEGATPVQSGNPLEYQNNYGIHPQQPDSGTSHISVVDRHGNAVSMTTTIEQSFGSRIFSDGGTGLPGGFLLNNQLTDFSLVPYDNKGKPIANRVQPGKRPRSSMSPTLIFKKENGALVASVGSPGGAGIIHFTAKTILGMLDFGLNAQEAISLPNFVNYNGASILEKGRFSSETIEALEMKGHLVLERDLTSGLQAIKRTETGYFGGADPRREGIVVGE